MIDIIATVREFLADPARILERHAGAPPGACVILTNGEKPLLVIQHAESFDSLLEHAIQAIPTRLQDPELRDAARDGKTLRDYLDRRDALGQGLDDKPIDDAVACFLLLEHLFRRELLLHPEAWREGIETG